MYILAIHTSCKHVLKPFTKCIILTFIKVCQPCMRAHGKIPMTFKDIFHSELCSWSGKEKHREHAQSPMT